MRILLIRYRKIIFIFFATKVILLIFSLFAFWLVSKQEIRGVVDFLSIWNRWDAPHYVWVAQHGYLKIPPLETREGLFIVFLPFYPIIITFMSLFTMGNHLLAAMLTSFSCAFLATVLLYEICLDEFNKKIGIVAVWFLNIFPTSYFLIAGYSESVFLTLSLAFYLSIQKKRYLIAAILGLVSSLTRLNSILLSIFTPGFKKWKIEVLYPFIGLILGFFLYLNFNLLLFGDHFYFLEILKTHWYKQLAWPWIGFKSSIDTVLSKNTPLDILVFAQEPIYLISLLGFGVYVFLKVNRGWGLYVFSASILFSSTTYILSTPRYALSLFPIFVALAILSTNKLLLSILSIASISFLLLFTLLFVNGHWAF